MKKNAHATSKMTGIEKKIALALASLFAFRMFGLFLLFPVFSVLSTTVTGGNNPTLKGMALGAYGMTQAILLIPFGLASDRWGRKPVVVFGLLLFILGGIVCVMADNIYGIIIGRALQGAGAVSAAISAWLADSMREAIRTRAMAMVGSSIGLSFAASVVVAPLVSGWWGLKGLFMLVTLMGVLACLIAIWGIPELASKPSEKPTAQQSALNLLKNRALWRLNFGVFIAHAALMGLFLLIPHWILQHQEFWTVEDLWKVYLPVIIVALVLMVILIIHTEKRQRHIVVLRVCAFLLAFCILGFAWIQQYFWGVVLALCLFFTIFNMIEALQPSLVARMVTSENRGMIMGVYNVCQSLGVFLGGALGGWMLAHSTAIHFVIVLCVLTILWGLVQLLPVDQTPVAHSG